MNARAAKILAIVGAVFLFACSDDDDARTSSGPQRACEDTADAVAKAAQRCGLDSQANAMPLREP